MAQLALLLTGLAVLAGWLVLIRDWRVSVHWQRVPAVIRMVRVEEHQTFAPEYMKLTADGFRVVVVYQYTVDDQRYTGRRYYANREPFFLTRGEAENFAAKLPEGGELTLYVDPQRPTRSLIARKLIWVDYIPGVAGALLVLGALVV